MWGLENPSNIHLVQNSVNATFSQSQKSHYLWKFENLKVKQKNAMNNIQIQIKEKRLSTSKIRTFQITTII